MIDKISRYKQYFLRGHTGWFSLALSLINFSLIFYSFFLGNIIPGLGFLPFFLIFFVFYSSICTIVGFIDLRKGTYKGEASMYYELSPIWQDITNRLTRIERGVYDNADER